MDEQSYKNITPRDSSKKKKKNDFTDTVLISDSAQEGYKEELEEMLECIRRNEAANSENITRFRNFQRIVFKTALTNDDTSVLNALGRPNIEFNMLNPMVDRLGGEFSKQEPSIYASSSSGGISVDEQQLAAVQGALSHIIFESSENNTQLQVYLDQITGGWSVYKVTADYENDMSFDITPKISKVYDATLVGFDDMARGRTKSDAEWCYELFPMTLENFKKEYPNIDTTGMQFYAMGKNFKFTYAVGKYKIVIVAEFYKKKKEKTTILRLSNNQVVKEDDYEEMVASWQQIEQVPEIVDKRETLLQKVYRYKFAGDKMIEYEKDTISRYLPLVYADGNSVFLHDSSDFGQFTKPYMFHAYGMQRLINLSGQTIANDIENMTMQKLFIPKEAIPKEADYQDSITDYQKSDVIVYNAFMQNDPDKPVPPPREVQRVGLPPEVPQTFNSGMQMLQNITGSYDAQLGVNNNDLSGKAIVEGATQSNATAMPYVVNNVLALNQCAIIIADMLPKITKTPRTMPIRTKEGKSEFIRVNDPSDPNSISLDYGSNAIGVRVKAGVNFEIEKNRALEQLFNLMKALPTFNQFISESPVGGPILLKNMSFHGVDIVTEEYEKWLKQQQQQPPKPDPDLMNAQSKQQDSQARMLTAQTEQAKVQSDIQTQGYETAIKAKQVENETMDSGTRRIEALATIGESKNQLAIEAVKVAAEDKRTKLEMGLAVGSAMRDAADQEHNHLKDILEIHNNVVNDKNEAEQQSKSDSE